MAVYINRQAPQSGIASLLALQGRGGDTELVHMTKPEVRRLQQTGLMSINPDTGLPEYFLGDFFKGIKNTVKNIFKPENIIPAVASIALPAFAGPAFGNTSVGQFLGPTASQALLSGAGTTLGSLPFRDPGDAFTAGVVSGGLQYGGSKLKEFLGGIGGGSAYDVGKAGSREAFLENVADRARKREQMLVEDFPDFEELDIVPDVLDFDTGELAEDYFLRPPLPQSPNLQNQQLQEFLTRPESLTPEEAQRLGRGLQQLPRKEFEQATNMTRVSPEEVRTFIKGEISNADQVFNPSLDEQVAMVRAAKQFKNRYVTPESFDRFSEARKTFQLNDTGTYLKAAKEFGSELDFGDVGTGLASVEATSLVDAMEAQRLAEEKAAQDLINQGIPEPIARRRVAQRRAAGEFGRGGAALTAEEAKRRAIQGGGFEFFGPTQFVPAAHGGLVSLAAGGKPDFEGMVTGNGHGMEDNQIMEIKGGGLLAVSPKEYVVPADVMAMLGNGNPDDGADEMDKFIADFRKSKYGRAKQPPEMNGSKALQSLVS
jgi:hypothetical protein